MQPAALSALLQGGAYGFIMTLCRCGAVVMLLPGLAEDETPTVLRAAFAGVLAILLYPLVAAHFPPEPADLPHLAVLLGGEILAGLFLGWLARLICLALPVAGQIIALATGLSSVLQPDVNFGAQTSGPGQLLGRLLPVLLLGSDLWMLPLGAIAGSYAIWPPGSMPPSGDVMDLVLRGTEAEMALALRLAAPFLFIGAIWQVAMGLISRLVPQLQIYFAALPGQVLGGLLLLSVLAGALARVFLAAAEAQFSTLPGS